MTRQKCKSMLPLITAYIEGKHIQYFSDTLIGNHRGWWQTPDEDMGLGFAGSISWYRIKNPDGSFEYFDESSKQYAQRDADDFKTNE